MTNEELINTINVLNELNQVAITDMKKALEFVKYKKSLISLVETYNETRTPYLLKDKELEAYNKNEMSPDLKESISERLTKLTDLGNLEVEIPKLNFNSFPIPENIAQLQAIIPLCLEDVEDIIDQFNETQKDDK